jgi:hypothetical protein
MSSFVSALIGGVITILIALLLRLLLVPGEARADDRRSSDRNDDLSRWIADRDVWLRRELRDGRNQLAARGALDSGD